MICRGYYTAYSDTARSISRWWRKKSHAHHLTASFGKGWYSAYRYDSVSRFSIVLLCAVARVLFSRKSVRCPCPTGVWFHAYAHGITSPARLTRLSDAEHPNSSRLDDERFNAGRARIRASSLVMRYTSISMSRNHSIRHALFLTTPPFNRSLPLLWCHTSRYISRLP